ncbi:MAG: transcriptional initiation protein Tat [Proteobacteria bacterium]|nr:transcriptional initiation protein Tat [Pseudomonadota bacterium]
MTLVSGRREAIQTLGVALAAASLSGLVNSAGAAQSNDIPSGASALAELTDRLAKTPRRRDFKTVPMILDRADQWDSQALKEILSYKPDTKQAWDHTDISGPWLNLMRNALNAQIWSFNHPDFLVVSATHGSAQLALYDQPMWDKYQLAKLAGKGIETNTFIIDRPAADGDAADYQNPAGVFSGQNNSIVALQRRGVVFMACHNAIWEQATKLHGAGVNPDNLSIDGITAELTNHLVPGVVLTPGAVATLPELQQAGFHYGR